MLEKVGDKDIIVRNYVDNFNVKEYIEEELIPKAFPNIPMNKLNVGFTGVISEYISQAIEDAYGTASLMLNENFITKAVLPESIYAEAAKFDLGYSFATPSTCSFALQISISDILENSEPVQNTTSYRYILDKDTQIELGDNIYKLDYDIYIDHRYIDDRLVFNVYYNDDGTNPISTLTSKYIKHQVTTIDWLVLFLNLKQFDREENEEPITDNILTTNSDIEVTWTDQIAGLGLTYVSPTGQRLPMQLKPLYSKPSTEPFVWYHFEDDDTIKLSFSSVDGYWAPEFNSTVEYIVYTTIGADANFTSYDRHTGVPVTAEGENYPYNEDTTMVAVCYSGSQGGVDQGDIEDLRDDTILAENTVNVLTTDNDLNMWFERYAKKNGTKSKFFKRRDDPSGRLFAQFVAIKDGTYVYPTNTLNIRVSQDQFDYVNSDVNDINQEFIIKPGHIWEYDDSDATIRNRLKMVEGTDGMAMISNDVLPAITDTRKYMFVNPFYIKIHRDPTTMVNYNYLIDYTSWPEVVEMTSNSAYQFQMATISIERTIGNTDNNMYHIEAIVVPIIKEDVTYIEKVDEDHPKEKNNLRVVLITRTSKEGETGYIEMEPKDIDTESGSYTFEVNIAVDDNISSDMQIQVDLNRTPSIHSLIKDGSNVGKVLIDANEASFHFAIMMKDDTNSKETGLYSDPSFDGYTLANRFQNNYRDLQLYQPLSMMRSMITFSGTNNNYTVDVSLVPFLRYDLPLNDSRMKYFIQTFNAQYDAMKPVLRKLDGNSFLDFKLYNTYGRSNNYYIGPEEGKDNLKDSTILLDNVYVNVQFVISVYDRSLYTQTVSEVKNQIKETFDKLDTDGNTDLYVSNLIRDIVDGNPNVRYLRFLGFNDYDANKQAIFVKYTDISELTQDQLMVRVPEIIRVDDDSILINEET